MSSGRVKPFVNLITFVTHKLYTVITVTRRLNIKVIILEAKITIRIFCFITWFIVVQTARHSVNKIIDIKVLAYEIDLLRIGISVRWSTV